MGTRVFLTSHYPLCFSYRSIVPPKKVHALTHRFQKKTCLAYILPLPNFPVKELLCDISECLLYNGPGQKLEAWGGDTLCGRAPAPCERGQICLCCLFIYVWCMCVLWGCCATACVHQTRVCVCAQPIDRALSPTAGSEVMDEAAELYLNPLTSLLAWLTEQGENQKADWEGWLHAIHPKDSRQCRRA